jgi:hypothetical protein
VDNSATKTISPGYPTAAYKTQRLPQFKGNKLIEALPALLTDDQLFEHLNVLPEFDEEQRNWSKEERLHMLKTLGSFMVVQSRHIVLARSLDSMLRAGYVGRVPRTPEHALRLQRTYDIQDRGAKSAESILTSNPQLSTLLMGVSGMGKTTATKRWFSHMPQVIFHPETNLYQITYLHVEMPSDGSSIKGLAHAILHQIDKLIPGANYYETYARRGKPGADTLMRSVARVMNQHFVGFLIADEIQNLANSHKGKQIVMTELVSACNELGVPILFIGTNKASEVFSLDFRQSRRASGHGLSHWDRLTAPVDANDESDDSAEANEWNEFVAVLWAFQWVKKPVKLTHHLSSTLYHFSQGVIDIAIKIFASVQARAILDGSECITPELIADVYSKELKLLHPMVEALRANDLERLATFADIAPVGIGDLLQTVNRKLKAKASPAYGVKAEDPTFKLRIASALVAAGFDENDSIDVAEKVADEGKAKDLKQGVEEGLKALTATKAVPRTKAKPTKDSKSAPERPDFASRPNDYRRAIIKARDGNTSIYSKLQELGMAQPLEELLELC